VRGAGGALGAIEQQAIRLGESENADEVAAADVLDELGVELAQSHASRHTPRSSHPCHDGGPPLHSMDGDTVMVPSGCSVT
jgi:hypothetical protein